MSAPRELRNVVACVDFDARVHKTGNVKLYGFAAWLKGEPLVGSILTPTEARKLATQLLVSAESAEATR